MSDKRIIEVDGVKIEVDLRTAKRVETLRVGSRVRVLVKPAYGKAEVHHGVVIGFEPFNELPTIIIAYMAIEYANIDLKFVHYNKNTQGVEIVASIDDDHASLDKDEALRFFEVEIEKKQGELKDLEDRRRYFLEKFSSWWNPTVPLEVSEDDLPE